MELTKNKKLFLVAICAFIVCIISTVSYAHFFATSTGVSRTTFIKTGHMEITYTDGSVIGSTSNMLPGQYVEKSFSVRNTGNVDTYYSINLNDVANTFVTKSDLVCEIINQNGIAIAHSACPDVNQAIKRHISLPVGVTHNYTLRVTFDETNVNQDDNKGKSFSAKIGLSEDTKPPYTIVSGDLYTVGSIVKIANEEFYVIGQEDAEHVKLLSKWNLKVGSGNGQYGLNDNLQFNGYDFPVKFSSSNYWNDSPNNVKPEYGNHYHAYVYTNYVNNGTSLNFISQYVDEYVKYLNKQGVWVSGRLITEEELKQLGCVDFIPSSCNPSYGGSAPEWVYQTSYWSGTASGPVSIVAVDNTGKFVTDDVEYDYQYYESNGYGVRPVIILETEEKKDNYTVLSGDLDTEGSIVKIANEEFYVFGQQDANHVKLLSRWNLNVGSNSKGTETNLQDEDVRGLRQDGEVTYGGVAYSSSAYWGDSAGFTNIEYGHLGNTYTYTSAKDNGVCKTPISGYVDNYVNYLNKQGVHVSGRLISKDEFVMLGCSSSSTNCTSAPSWLYQTSFWSGSYSSRAYMYGISTSGINGGVHFSTQDAYGVRPVIILER